MKPSVLGMNSQAFKPVVDHEYIQANPEMIGYHLKDRGFINHQ
jgi:hypothetical protein